MRASVVVTTYNRRAIVTDAVDSALNQSLSDIEVIVVDDGSTDGTAAMLAGRFSNDVRFRLVERTNGGPPAARNTGLDAASGPYLAFLDSDDVWHRDYLASQIAVLESNPDADLVLSNGMCHTPTGEASRLFDIVGWRFPATIDDMCVMSYMLPSMTLFRTDVVRELRFDEAFRVCDDTDFMWRFLDTGHQSVGNSETLVEYRAVAGHEGSAPQLNADLDPIWLAQYEIWKRYSDRYPQALEREDPDFHRELADVLVRHGRLREARQAAERLAQTRPDDANVERLLRLTATVTQ